MDNTIKRNRRFRKLKRFAVVITILTACFFVYVEWANRNSKNMTYRQKFLKAVYPVLMWFTKTAGKNSEVVSNTNNTAPLQSFYRLSVTLGNGSTLDCSTLKGKKVLLVNTASDCGYTNQYADLQKLYETQKDKLVIIGFPANDFKEQEKGNDASIGEFCKINYGVTFPIATKGIVIKGAAQQPVFQWLTDKNKNGWSEQAPTWNFCKYLLNEQGVLTHFFAASVSPAADVVVKAVEGER